MLLEFLNHSSKLHVLQMTIVAEQFMMYCKICIKAPSLIDAPI